MNRDKKLRKRVQRLERMVEREEKKPRSQERSQRLSELRGKASDARRELTAYRDALVPEIVQLAQRCLDHKKTRCENFRTSDGQTAGDVLREFVKRDGRVYCKQAGKDVVLNENMLRTILRLAKYGVLPINCLTNGTHSGADSPWPLGAHPRGEGLDIGKNGLGVAVSVIMRLGAKVRAYVLNEDAGHWHMSFR